MHDTVTLANDWISLGTGFGNDLKGLIFNVGIPVLCGVFVLVIGFKTKAPGPTIMAVIFAGIVWGLSASMGTTIKSTTTDTITHYDGSTVRTGDQ
ncbi:MULTISPECIES: hypothetical protein [Streptomyces]|uniref:hypothetical protein n=1 Tax=Streptomyces TaxID=1883 RepID=UPI0036C79E46